MTMLDQTVVEFALVLPMDDKAEVAITGPVAWRYIPGPGQCVVMNLREGRSASWKVGELVNDKAVRVLRALGLAEGMHINPTGTVVFDRLRPAELMQALRAVTGASDEENVEPVR